MRLPQSQAPTTCVLLPPHPFLPPLSLHPASPRRPVHTQHTHHTGSTPAARAAQRRAHPLTMKMMAPPSASAASNTFLRRPSLSPNLRRAQHQRASVTSRRVHLGSFAAIRACMPLGMRDPGRRGMCCCSPHPLLEASCCHNLSSSGPPAPTTCSSRPLTARTPGARTPAC